MKQFKIRASQAGTIMTGTIGLLDKQKERYNELSERDKGNGKPLTDNMTQELARLKEEMNNPTIPQTLISYCEQWLKEQIYGRHKRIETKYMEKGNIMEDQAIDTIADYLGIGMAFKNEQNFENDHMTGTPDIILNDVIIDAKCSWDCFTFPLFESDINPTYYAQGQVYMHLTGRKKFKLIYVLLDAPLNLIEREAYYYSKKQGYDELDTDIFEKFEKEMTYKGLDQKYLIREFEFEYDANFITELINRVEICREYINTKI